MLQPSDVVTKEQGIFGLPHKGIVVSNLDPEYKRRLKVRVPGILEGDENTLPWCMPKLSSGFGDNATSDIVDIPEVGAELTIEFPYKEIHMPFYTGHWGLKPVPEEFQVNYPERHGWKDKTGTVLYFDSKEKTMAFNHVSGFKVTLDAEGQLDMSTPAGVKIDLAKVLEIIAKEATKITSPKFDVIASSYAKFDTPTLESTGNVKDSVRTMAADRIIYNGHQHNGKHGPTSPPTSKK